MPEAATTHNINEYSVSEIAGGIKRVVEETFGYVRVRGEVSGWRGPHSSGHAYFRLKDDKAVLEAVCWKGSLGQLGCKLEEGLEIIATGRITTYPGSSKYQIVIERAEPAGVGALMALLEKRKKMLEAEGLFAPERKQLLPFMPRVIGVVTSPTGAVIRDILHRIADRFPCHVIVWPVAVQGPGAAEQIAAAIDGFNLLGGEHDSTNQSPPLRSPSLRGVVAHAPPVSSPPLLAKPDVIIVARGGGSLEDLWAFNEEIVVRAAANSSIPLISAVGHETDTTLIDFAADVRAPTPTAAAEMAVPVREEWLATLENYGHRLTSASRRQLQDKSQHVQLLARALPNPARLLEQAMQRLDETAERLHGALPTWLARRRESLSLLIGAFRPRVLMQEIARAREQLLALDERKKAGWQRYLARIFERMESFGPRLESINVQRLLERGFALVQGKGGLITSADAMRSAGEATLRFADGSVKIRTQN